MDLCGPRLCLRHRALGRRRCDWSAALCERIAPCRTPTPGRQPSRTVELTAAPAGTGGPRPASGTCGQIARVRLVARPVQLSQFGSRSPLYLSSLTLPNHHACLHNQTFVLYAEV